MEKQKLDGVEDTLFIPLMARSYISKMFPEYFCDEKAIELETKLPKNKIIENSSEQSIIGCAARALVMDKEVCEYAKNKEKINVVCVGCGLETMSNRLSNLNAHFFQIDFEDVILKRKEFLGEYDNETLIAGNATKLDFSEFLDCNISTIFVVAGVFQYFKETEVLSIVEKIKTSFKDAEILFDAVNEFGLKHIQKYVKKTGNESAMIYFYINNAKDFAKKTNTELLLCKGFYEEVTPKMKKSLKLYTKISMTLSDKKGFAKIIKIC